MQVLNPNTVHHHCILCTRRSPPVHGAACSLSKCTREMAPAHWITCMVVQYSVLQAKKPTALARIHSLHFTARHSEWLMKANHLAHVSTMVTELIGSSKYPMQLPSPNSAMILYFTRCVTHPLTPLGFCSHNIEHCPIMIPTTESLTIASAAPLQWCSP